MHRHVAEREVNFWAEYQRRWPAGRTHWAGEAPLRAAFPGAPDALVDVIAALGTGELIDGNRLFTLDEANARRASALAQLARERGEVVEFGAAQCFGQGHDTAQACLDALTELEPVAAGLYPLMGPDDVYDFVYVVCGGAWHGRVGNWYHDYPICELFEEPPAHADLAAFGAHLLEVAADDDARLL